MRRNPIALLLRRHLSSSSTTPSPLKLKNIFSRHRPRALAAARAALTEYLHSTRSLPFAVADAIASNAPSSLNLLLSSVRHLGSPSLFPGLLRRHLSYRPVDELDFFSESIGLHSPLHSPSPFLLDHPRLLSSVSALSAFGFPWTRLGLLSSAFTLDAPDITSKLNKFESFGLTRVSVIGICLAFPWVLDGIVEEEEVETIFKDLRAVFVDNKLDECAGEDVERIFGICRRIRAFYDVGTEMGTIGELVGRNKKVFLEEKEEVLKEKLGFFLRLGVRKEEVGGFVLRNGEIFELDLESWCISMPEYLVSLGLSEEGAVKILEKYPYVMGKNKLGNLPGVLKAIDMREWFLDKGVNGDRCDLTPRYTSFNVESCNDEEKILTKKNKTVEDKLEFFFSIGLGKNELTFKAKAAVHETKDQLQERFDCLIEWGFEHSTVCRMINVAPKLLNQSKESISEKVDYLLNELGHPLEYLINFPTFLCFDLENRIKPRYKIMNWLEERGLRKRNLSHATALANDEMRFIVNLYYIHPAAPKLWLETFSPRSDSHGNQRYLFAPHP